MEKRNFLEKLGLIEKIESMNQVDNKNVEITEKGLVSPKNENSQVTKVLKQKIDNFDKLAIGDESEPIAMVKEKTLLKIEEIYKKYDIKTEGINSLSIVESFKKALPDYLPTDVKRHSILKIITSSNVELGSLINDGNDKLVCLSKFLDSSTKELNTIIFECEKEINKLTEKINDYNTAIDMIKNLHKEQDYIVKYEIERINDILQFIDTEDR